MNYQMHTFKGLEENALQAVAIQLAKQAKKGDIFFLKGTLGAGKTTFSKYFIQEFLEKNISITSPTFTLMNMYEKDEGNRSIVEVCHCDFYRLETLEDIYELGFFDGMNRRITLVEWPELLDSVSLKQRHVLSLSMDEHTTRRTLTLEPSQGRVFIFNQKEA
jgi:tRNA threonylcarbamoyl adenosine modification protein YjeE